VTSEQPTSVAYLKGHVRLAVAANCELRPIVDGDVTDAYVAGLNDPVVTKHLVSVREPQTRDMVVAYVAANAADDTCVLFGIFIDGALRGTVRLHGIDRVRCCATLGILIFDTGYWRQGWGARAIAAVVEFGATSLGIRMFEAGMYDDNVASQRAFAAAGFHPDPHGATIHAGRGAQVWRWEQP
jgi:RimJ/RimL family protein N-acetyltransferase